MTETMTEAHQNETSPELARAAKAEVRLRQAVSAAAGSEDNGQTHQRFLRALIDYRRAAGPRPPEPKAHDFEGRIRAAQEGARRIADPDKVERAGQPSSEDPDWTLMHNGIEVPTHAYYGEWMTRLIALCEGRHEPQEEHVFDRVLPYLPDACRSLELGSFWAFYTASLLRAKGARARAMIMEPDLESLGIGLATLQRNGVGAQPVLGRIGAADVPAHVTQFGATVSAPQITFPELMDRAGWDRIDLLHADIQRAEIPLMSEIAPWLAERRIGFIFISTHGFDEHLCVLETMHDHGYRLVAEHDLAESYSYDGLVVAQSPDIPGPGFIDLPRKTVGVEQV